MSGSWARAVVRHACCSVLQPPLHAAHAPSVLQQSAARQPAAWLRCSNYRQTAALVLQAGQQHGKNTQTNTASPHLSGGVGDGHARRLQGADLVLRRALAACTCGPVATCGECGPVARRGAQGQPSDRAMREGQHPVLRLAPGACRAQRHAGRQAGPQVEPGSDAHDRQHRCAVRLGERAAAGTHLR